MAERKAIQTGKVTRLLKETAVDCTKHKADKLYGGKYVKGVRKPAGGDEVGEWGDYSVQDRRQGVFGNVRLYG
jgi:hypothetical protein